MDSVKTEEAPERPNIFLRKSSDGGGSKECSRVAGRWEQIRAELGESDVFRESHKNNSFMSKGDGSEDRCIETRLGRDDGPRYNRFSRAHRGEEKAAPVPVFCLEKSKEEFPALGSK